AIDATKTMLTQNGSGDMLFNVPTNDLYRFFFNNIEVWDLSNSQLIGPSVILNKNLVLNNSGIDPSINGEFRQNGNNVKIFSGGNVVNVSTLISNPLTSDLNFAQHKAINISEIDFFSSGSPNTIVSNSAGTEVDFNINGNIALKISNSNNLISSTVFEIWGNGVSQNTVPVLKTNSTPAIITSGNQIGAISFDSYNSSTVRKTYVQILATANQVIANSEHGELDFLLINNGLLYQGSRIYNTGTGTQFELVGTSGNLLSINKASGTPALYTATEGHQFQSGLGGIFISPTEVQPLSTTTALGDLTHYYTEIFVKNVKLGIGAINTSLSMITSNGSNDMIVSVPLTSSVRFYFNNIDKFDISSSQFQGPNIILSNTLTIQNSSFDPNANG
ncbi:MAG TPA: hypothetical protein VKR58_07910, partial [Aquella sp.]|nr:hypothetical protein [Aquella sp.]